MLRKLAAYLLLLAVGCQPAVSGNARAIATPPAEHSAQPAQNTAAQESFDVVYVKRGDLELRGDIFVPEGAGPFPGVLMVHGGAWQRGSKQRFAPVAKELAGQGFTVMSIDYRLAPQFKFPAQLEDCRDAVRFMRREAARYKIDPAHLGGCGYSAGGHLVCLLATEDPPLADPAAAADKPFISTRLQAVAAGGVPCDFRSLDPDSTFLAYWLGGTPRQCPDKYLAASPRAFVSADDPPMFFYHGQNDWLVPLLSPESMVKSLHDSKVAAELFVVPGASHMQAQFDRKAMAAAVGFLQRTLKPAKP
ncbi:MAG: alpha/beta hydrolase [Planctomycetes bacterium]|nr:alpha/beta hydrolase [Planctomycetota bacterium]